MLLSPDRPARAALLTLPLLLAGGTAQEEQAAFDGERAWRHLEHQVALGPRPSGSPAIEKLRTYLAARIEEAGLTPVREEFTAPTPEGMLAFANVYADLAPADATADTPVVVLATHFDTKRLDFEFLGANDGGSGTAVLLELMRVLALRADSSVTLRFLFLDGEEALRSYWAGEDNCYGSRHHVRELRKSGLIARVQACVVLDMVGDADLQLTSEGFSTPELLAIFFDAADEIGLGDKVGASARDIKDDHQRFLEAGIPSVDLIDFEYGLLNEHWHDAGDSLEHCSRESLDAIGRIVLAGLPALERFALRLAAADPPRR